MIKLIELLKEGQAEYPADYKPGIKVTKGGSMCANCEYWVEKSNECKNKYWLQWHDNDPKIPYPGDEYCCDWWHSK